MALSFWDIIFLLILLLAILIYLVLVFLYCRQKRKKLNVQNYEDVEVECLQNWLENNPTAQILPKKIGDKNSLTLVDDANNKIIMNIQKVLGSGHFGEVFAALIYFSNKPDKPVKIALKTFIHDRMTADAFRCELNLLNHIMRCGNHENVVKKLSERTKLIPHLIVFEFIDGKSLNIHLKNDQLDMKQLLSICAQVANGMDFLGERASIVHRDLAARNILILLDPFTAKIGDFGLARMLKKGVFDGKKEKSKLPLCTDPIAYKSKKFSAKSDVYSFGILLYEIFAQGQTPYDGMKKEDIQKIRNGESIIEYLVPPFICPAEVYLSIMKPCLIMNPEERPSFKNILNKFSTLQL